MTSARASFGTSAEASFGKGIAGVGQGLLWEGDCDPPPNLPRG